MKLKLVQLILLLLLFSKLSLRAQNMKSYFVFNGLEITIDVQTQTVNDSLQIIMFVKNENKESIFMGSFKPIIRWYLDSCGINVAWGEDYKFWRESYYNLGELKPQQTKYIVSTVVNPHKDNFRITLNGQYIQYDNISNRTNLTNRDLNKNEYFRSFYFIFHPVIEISKDKNVDG